MIHTVVTLCKLLCVPVYNALKRPFLQKRWRIQAGHKLNRSKSEWRRHHPHLEAILLAISCKNAVIRGALSGGIAKSWRLPSLLRKGEATWLSWPGPPSKAANALLRLPFPLISRPLSGDVRLCTFTIVWLLVALVAFVDEDMVGLSGLWLFIIWLFAIWYLTPSMILGLLLATWVNMEASALFDAVSLARTLSSSSRRSRSSRFLAFIRVLSSFDCVVSFVTWGCRFWSCCFAVSSIFCRAM